MWLLKAYVRKWRRTIFLSFSVGLIVFFILKFGVNYFVPLLPFTQQKTIGMVGAYSVDNLPHTILSKVSQGLTQIKNNDTVKPDLASSWEIKNNGKTYIFHLKNNVYFSDGTKFTSDQVKYNFLNVNVERPNKYTIIFNLKNIYAPFLITVSRPIFKDGFVGIGEYRVQALDLNGNFVQSISLVKLKERNKELVYQFYPTEDSLKTAFALGEVKEISGATNPDFNNKSFYSFVNADIKKTTDYSQLVAIFYNTQDKNLSDKRIREALSYAMPDKFLYGVRNYGPFTPFSWVNKYGLTTYSQGIQHAKSLLKDSLTASESSAMVLDIKTLPLFLPVAHLIKKAWDSIGIKSNIETVSAFPSNFQVYLGEYNVPKDPDQYTLWHSSQMNNITNYKNLRIDKLLEDGRQTLNINKRGQIYSDFQKYLLDDPPATFLYFPYVYDITRK